MSHEAKFKRGDLIVNKCGDTAVVRDAEPDGEGYIVVNVAENPDSEKDWSLVFQNSWTKVRQYPERWLVFNPDGRVVVDCVSLEAARKHTAIFVRRRILHTRKDGSFAWIDNEEED